jgi:hypothetical protein
MHSALIFSERSGAWCTALRRLLAEGTAEILQTRSLAECRQALTSRPASLLVVEASAETLPALVTWLARLSSDFPRAQVAVVADRAIAEHRFEMHEAGAFAVITSRRALRPLADAARIFFASQPTAEMSLTERVWNSLPWK